MESYKSTNVEGEGKKLDQQKRRKKLLKSQRDLRHQMTDRLRHLVAQQNMKGRSEEEEAESHNAQHIDKEKENTEPAEQIRRDYGITSNSRSKRKRPEIEKTPPVYSSPVKSPCLDFDTIREDKTARKEARRRRAEDEEREKYSEHIMLWEELRDIPGDLATKWNVVPLPSNTKRCLVISTQGRTTARFSTGELCCRFSSALPGGSATRGSHNPPSTYSVLDCLFDQDNSTFYVIDLLCWKTHMYYDCDTVFRHYWLNTKLEEEKGCSQISKNNPYRFVPLPAYAADWNGIATAASTTSDVRFGFRREGVLFVHHELFYTLGTTPLACHLSIDHTEQLLHFLHNPQQQGNTAAQLQPFSGLVPSTLMPL
eukprot:TRINITY_DN6322_c0_g1_i1.p1 TRINITY_DN6322_c0_g1~~TRINITY_DN6322_c0_g1_i1.p1  ORF type:complete len:417 (+),score=74.30 TRINITY_DN6322_c0_g1_i1:145-1251(+)